MIIRRKLQGGRGTREYEIYTKVESQIVEQFPDLRQGDVVAKTVTLPAGTAVRVPLGGSSPRGVRMLTSVADVRVASGELPEAEAAAGSNVLDYAELTGSTWAPANGIYGPFPAAPNDGQKVYKVDGPEGQDEEKYFQWGAGIGQWDLILDFNSSGSIEYVQSAGAADPTGSYFADGFIVDPDGATLAQESLRSESVGAVGSTLAVDVWEVRLLPPTDDLRLFSATGGSVKVETF